MGMACKKHGDIDHRSASTNRIRAGRGWRSPQKSVGKQTVQLPAGRHKLILFFDGISTQFTFFCKLVLSPAARPGE